jgi:hypothetical protein
LNEENDEFSDSIDELFIKPQLKIIEALVYSARAQGLRAGVRPYTGEQDTSLDENGKPYPPIERTVFIEYPEKTIEWPFGEVQAKYLDSFPQYES